METDLHKVLKQKVPYHAHVYPEYKQPVTGSNRDRDLQELFKKAVQVQMDDDRNDGSHDENALLAKIKRAHNIAGTEEDEDEDRELSVFCYTSHYCFLSYVEERIRRSGWSIENFKIFYIWNTRVNGKLGYFPRSAKFQALTNEIKVEMHSGNENEISKGKVVDLIINPDDCDRILTARGDDWEVDYSVFGDGWRVELEIRLYDVDGNPVVNVSGRIRARFDLGEAEHDIIFLDGEQHNAESGNVFRKMLILPRRILGFLFEMEIEGNSEKFVCRIKRGFMICRSVPIDEQLHIWCGRGYVQLRAKWGCCCVDEGLCVCPGAAVCGIEAFRKLSKSSEESGEDGEGSKR